MSLQNPSVQFTDLLNLRAKDVGIQPPTSLFQPALARRLQHPQSA